MAVSLWFPLYVVVALGVLRSHATALSPPPLSMKIDWPALLGRSDLVWEWDWSGATRPLKYYHSAFVGNGAQGMFVRVNETNPDRTMVFVISSSSIWDDRPHGYNFTSYSFIYDRPRLPVGEFYLVTEGTIVRGRMRLDLWNAVLMGQIETTLGT